MYATRIQIDNCFFFFLFTFRQLYPYIVSSELKARTKFHAQWLQEKRNWESASERNKQWNLTVCDGAYSYVCYIGLH